LYAGSALRRSEQSHIWWMVWEGWLPTREGHIPGVTFLLMMWRWAMNISLNCAHVICWWSRWGPIVTSVWTSFS
jgi:hypothetical protein